jgi:ubiquinone/menaquinone biosynthesis C-methylase UbiE
MTTAKHENYFLTTGDADYQRLAILNKLYNPLAIHFLATSGVKEGMTILEVGCGTGHMACDLAKLVGTTGKVIAIDSSPAQIAVSKKTAEQAGIKNIEFLVHDMRELNTLNREYDATYGRWTIEFSENPKAILADMYRYLKPGGILAYEATNMQQTQFFSSPHSATVDKWHTLGPKVFATANYKLEFGFEAYHEFKKLGCNDIKTLVNQAIATTPEEKSVYRLGMYASTPALINKGIMTQAEIDDFCQECEELEHSDVICGFFKNILVSGVK